MFCSLLFNFVKRRTVLHLSTGWSHVTEPFTTTEQRRASNSFLNWLLYKDI